MLEVEMREKAARAKTMHDVEATARRSAMGGAGWLVPARCDAPELLDQGVGSAADVRTNLLEMARINRWFGGVTALTRHLYPLLQQASEPLRVVDLGTGSGEMARLIAQWAGENGRQIALYLLDISARNLAVTQEYTTLPLTQADVNALPFASDGIDYYISSLFLHHFTPEQLVNLLRETYCRARRGIIMSDLVRGYLPLLAFRVIQPIFAPHYLTRHDGLLSIRRAYTPDELRALAWEAGIETARVYSHFPWRMTLVAEKARV